MMTPSGEGEPSDFGLPKALRALEGLSLHEPSKEKEPKGSNDEPATEEAGKFGPSKAMLSKALIQANTAVLLDNAQRFVGAM
jgi:hypothetical protein